MVSNFATLTIEEATERLIDYRGKTPPQTDSGVRLITAKVVKCGQIHDEPAETEWAKQVEPLTELCWRLVDQIQNLRRTRDLLLPRLMSGQIDIHEEVI
jgi:hypothetical protein